MLEMLLRVKAENAKVILFGCTKIAQRVYAQIKSLLGNNINVSFYDNNVKKQGTYFCGEKVLDLKELEENTDAYFILTGLRSYGEMKEQLIDMGVPDEHIAFANEVVEHKWQEISMKRTPRKEMHFVVDLAEHCNLNCQCCDHFSPLAKPHFTDLKQFESDLHRMYEIFGEDVWKVKLEGGEPLLNPDVDDFLFVARKEFKNAKIELLTNGILLKDMKESFWEACKENRIEIVVTKYPIKVDYERLEKMAAEKGVAYRYYSDAVVKTSWKTPLDFEGGQDKYESFHLCSMSNSCSMLKKGKLYPCTMVPNLETFNDYFGLNMEVSHKDYIDIYSDVTKEEVYDFFCTPIPACRYCKVKERSGGYEWKVSSCRIEEWS